jgi:2-octaprenyl-6-methoxyphenol hydroxylase
MPAGETDVLVRGGGPVGCVAALALRGFKRVRIVGKESQAPAFRPIVLSYASRLILERLGVWHALEPTTIQAIHVSQAARFGRTVFEARDAGVPALGHVLEYSALLHALRQAVEDLLVEEETEARCVVHAEGAAPDAEEKRYSQDALVASVRFAGAAASTAFERFTDEGPLALLPVPGGYAVVWSMRPESAQERMRMTDSEFLSDLAAAAGSRPGRPVAVERRAVQPLVLRVREKSVAERAVYIGNAAQTLHPVAGQGLNLGLRDAWDLAQILGAAPDPGDAAVLRRFAARRRVDATAAVRVTDLLAQAFLRTNPLLFPLNAAALTVLDIFPAARRFFARRMIFGPSALP